MRFALDKLNIHIPEISILQLELFLRNRIFTQRPILILICGDQQNCFTFDERLIVAATFVNITLFIQKFIFTKIYFYQNAVFILY